MVYLRPNELYRQEYRSSRLGAAVRCTRDILTNVLNFVKWLVREQSPNLLELGTNAPRKPRCVWGLLGVAATPPAAAQAERACCQQPLYQQPMSGCPPRRLSLRCWAAGRDKEPGASAAAPPEGEFALRYI